MKSNFYIGMAYGFLFSLAITLATFYIIKPHRVEAPDCVITEIKETTPSDSSIQKPNIIIQKESVPIYIPPSEDIKNKTSESTPSTSNTTINNNYTSETKNENTTPKKDSKEPEQESLIDAIIEKVI